MDALRGACIQLKVARLRNRDTRKKCDTKKYYMSLVPQTILKFVSCSKILSVSNYASTSRIQVDKLLREIGFTWLRVYASLFRAPACLPPASSTFLQREHRHTSICTMPPQILNDSEDDEDIVVYDDSAQSSSHASGEAAPAITIDGTRDALNKSTGSTGNFVKAKRIHTFIG